MVCFTFLPSSHTTGRTGAILIVIVIAVACLALSARPVESAKFLFLSDLHLDPDYGTPQAGRGACDHAPAADHVLGTYGCDAPKSLVTSSIRNAAKEDPDVVLVSGDWIRHDGYELSHTALKHVVSNITSWLYEHVGHHRTIASVKPPVLDAVGNNDVVPDYEMDLSATYHPMLTDISDDLLSKKFLTATEAADFGKCGYFKRTVAVGAKNKSLDIIVLNTLLWDVELAPASQQSLPDPCGQFRFFEAAVNSSKTNPIITVAHIPPGVDLHGATGELQTGTPIDQVTYFWHDAHAMRFRNIVKANADRFRLMVFAHTHHFAMIADRYLNVPAIIVGAVSPIYYNRPMYLTMHFDDDTLQPNFSSLVQMGLTNFSASAVWEPMSPSFQQLYGLMSPSSSSSGLAASSSSSHQDLSPYTEFDNTMCADEARAVTWYQYAAANGKPPTACNGSCRLIASCFSQHITRNDTIECYKRGCVSNNQNDKKKRKEDPETIRIVAGIVITAIVLTMLFVVFRARQPRRESSGSLAGSPTTSLQPEGQEPHSYTDDNGCA